MKLSGLSWDEFNTEHIKKHGVTKEEVEEAYLLFSDCKRHKSQRKEICV